MNVEKKKYNKHRVRMHAMFIRIKTLFIQINFDIAFHFKVTIALLY